MLVERNSLLLPLLFKQVTSWCMVLVPCAKVQDFTCEIQTEYIDKPWGGCTGVRQWFWKSLKKMAMLPSTLACQLSLSAGWLSFIFIVRLCLWNLCGSCFSRPNGCLGNYEWCLDMPGQWPKRSESGSKSGKSLKMSEGIQIMKTVYVPLTYI